MPLSSALAPGFLRITYSGAILPHHMVIPVLPDVPPVPGAEPSFNTSSDSSKSMTDALGDIMDALEGSFADSTTFGLAEFYAVDPTSGVREFVYAIDINRAGTSTDPQIALVRATMQFKTSAGYPLKITMMEGVYEPNARNVGRVPVGPRQVLKEYVLSGDNVWYGRHNAYPLAFVSFTSKTDDKLRKLGGFIDV